MVYVDFVFQLYDVLTTAIENFFDWITKPILYDYVIEFLDPLLPEFIFELFGISSLADFTYVWFLGAGLVVYCIYSFITWLLNIVT